MLVQTAHKDASAWARGLAHIDHDVLYRSLEEKDMFNWHRHCMNEYNVAQLRDATDHDSMKLIMWWLDKAMILILWW